MKKLLIIASLALAGCTTQLGQFTVYCPDQDKVVLSKSLYRVDRTKKVKGTDPSTIYLLFPSHAPQYDQVVRNAMAERPECVGLADVTINRKMFWFLFGYMDFEAEGYPIVRKEAK